MKFSLALVAALVVAATAYSSSYNSGYTSSATGSAKTIKQVVTMTGTPATYVGNLKAMTEQGYGKALDIFDTTASPPAYRTGCSVTSTAAAARRTNIKVSFVATASAAQATAASTAATNLASNTASLTTAINAVKSANTAYSALTTPTVSAIAAPTVTAVSAAGALSTSIVALAVSALAAFQLRQ